MHDDLLDAVAWVTAKKLSDQACVAIMGASYGGYATLIGLTFTAEHVPGLVEALQARGSNCPARTSRAPERCSGARLDSYWLLRSRSSTGGGARCRSQGCRCRSSWHWSRCCVRTRR
ncbi:alpha/beta hydrolase family protein [Nannocystis exedens]|uniref:alpha/beta hydrolase family protein n=1 Tax=Nannocystis exedens TaxID=54 RepID=UPI001B806E17|nr:prolyl oligopeptidase family serine peptidase [Nannocystis exedens]